MTVRLVALLLEGALVQLLQAESADEVLGVELPEHGRNAAAGDRFVAAGTKGAALRMVVGLAVRLALVVEEGAAYERRPAVLENERLVKKNILGEGCQC